jgi:hypothetical protein
VTRAFRSGAIVSLQFRPLLTTWIFTVVVRAENRKLRRFFVGDACCRRQHERVYIFQRQVIIAAFPLANFTAS